MGEFKRSFIGLFLIVYLFGFWSSGAGKKNCCHAESTAPSSAQSEEFEDDPYATLQAEQRKRELQRKVKQRNQLFAKLQEY